MSEMGLFIAVSVTKKSKVKYRLVDMKKLFIAAANVKWKSTRNKPSVAKDEAAEALLDLLGDDGYAKLEDIQAMQKDIGCSERTLYRAKKDLQLDNVSIGFSQNKVTYWIAPDIGKKQFKEQKEKELLDGFKTISVPSG